MQNLNKIMRRMTGIMLATALVFTLTACGGGTTNGGGDPVPITIAAIPGVTAPVAGGTPVTAITPTAQYTGTVTWEPDVSGTFAANTAYTATITLTPKTGYTLQGVAADFFTVAGATTATNTANSGTITAVFPKTGGTAENPAVIDIAAIGGVTAPTPGGTPVTTITPTAQYTGTITWEPAVSGTFAADTEYTATITLTPTSGYTLKGVAANFFTVAGATASYAANSVIITVVFPQTFTSIEDMKTWLNRQPANTVTQPYIVNLNVTSLSGIDNSSFTNKYVYLDLSGSTITTIPDEAFVLVERYNGISVFYRASYSLTGITIPDSVTSIGESAFRSCTSLTGVTIPDSVTSIGESAFLLCRSLATITIPNSVTSIGDGAFAYCYSLPAINVAVDNSAFTTDDGVLYNKDKTTLIQYPAGKTDAFFSIPDSVTGIVNYAFGGSRFTSITIPNSVTGIGDYVFSWCENLTEVTIPDSITSIGEGAFEGCTRLTNITIPNSVTSIGDYVFSYCENLTEVTIGNSVTSIGEGAFEGCTSLTSVTIPNGVTSIGEGAFEGCTSLTNITVGSGNPNYASEEGILYNKEKTKILLVPQNITGAITIPDSVTSIGDEAFDYCTSLTEVTIGNSVTRIGNRAFYGCTSLTGVTIGNSVTNIGEFAFYGCTSLTSITFEGTIASGNFISYYSFLGDLRAKYLASGGGIGTYTTTAPVSDSSVWTKQDEG